MAGIIINIINNKGGVAKTATAVNTAAALARAGKRTLLIDNDTQCNATRLLLQNEQITRSLYNIYDPDEKEANINNCIYVTSTKYLDCLPNKGATGSLALKIIQQMLSQGTKDHLYIFRNKLRDYAINHYDFIFIDNPPNLEIFVMCALLSSDFVIVPNDSGSRASLEGLFSAVEFITEIRNNGNPDLKLLKILVTKLNKKLLVSRSIHEQTIRYFGKNRVFKTVIPVNTDIQKAELEAQTIFQFRSNAPAALAYHNLANEILVLIKQAENNPSLI
jgi:chromosome partitioning protein